MTRAAKKPVEKISEKKTGTNPECPSKSSKVRTPARRPKTEPVARLEPADEQVRQLKPMTVIATPIAPSDDAMAPRLRIERDGEYEIPSKLNPALRTRKYKEPHPDSEWRPWWKPRKRPLGGAKNPMVKKIREQIEKELAMDEGELARIPRDEETGRVVKSYELFTALLYWVARGGTLRSFCIAVDLPYGTCCGWLEKEPEVKAQYKEAERISADALVEYAQELATNPYIVEEVFESYDGEGNLIRKDVRRQDAVYARKLCVNFCQWLAAKRAPEKYGEKLKVETDVSMAGAIVAARRRLASRDDDIDADEVE